MNTRETLILKALQFKALHTGANNQDLIETFLDSDPKTRDVLTKNVCAHVSIEMAEEMEQFGEILGLSKREIITMALRDFFEKAGGVLKEFDAIPEGK